MHLQLTRLLTSLLMPLPLIMALLAAGLLVLITAKSRKTAIWLIASALVLLFAFSTPAVSIRALARLEGTYPLLDNPPPEAEWIVVLGGGVKFNDDRPLAARLGESSLQRMTEGVRLARLLPEAKLIASGKVTAPVAAAFAEEMGICRGRIVINSSPRNTHEESLEVKKLMGEDEKAILVTSASHMRRAAALFEGKGLTVIPSPTGHKAESPSGRTYLSGYLPRAINITFAEIVLKEKLGLLWAYLRRQA